jgi:hypothetical protein
MNDNLLQDELCSVRQQLLDSAKQVQQLQQQLQQVTVDAEAASAAADISHMTLLQEMQCQAESNAAKQVKCGL